MRRIDVILISLAVLVAGGGVYWLLQVAGVEAASAGVWTQFVLILGLLGWLGTYIYRALTKQMTYVQQLQDYEEAVLQKRYEEMTPEQLEQLQAELEQERRKEISG
jgi:hypothetical protein